MSRSTTTNFFFELNAQGETVEFHNVDGVSTSVALRHLIRPGDNPFKYRLPSLPKDRKLLLRNGYCKPDARIMAWLDRNGKEAVEKERALLSLRDDNGNVLVQWTLFGSFPIEGKSEKDYSKAGLTRIEELALGYGFFTVALK